MTQAHVKKSIILINRDFQLRFARSAVVVGLITSILTFAVVLFPLYQFEILRIPRFLPWPILAMMVCAVVVNVVSIGMLGILLTHRIAGPMYALVRSMRRIELGSWRAQLRVREADELKFVIRNFNSMVDGLMAQGLQDQLTVAEIRAGLQELADGDVKDKLTAAVDGLSDRIEQRLVQKEF